MKQDYQQSTELATTTSKFVAPKTAKECATQATTLIQNMMGSMLQYADKKYLARLQSVALSALVSNPKLMATFATSAGQTSFQVAVREAAESGLLCDGRQATIIPFGTQCKLMVMWQGMVETAYRTKVVKAFKHGKVCENDEFDWTDGEIAHKINFKADRGEVIGYWVRAIMTNGVTTDHFMLKEEVDKIRAKSRGKNEAPWTEHYDEMAYKTVLRNLYKWLPKTEEMDRVANLSDSELDLNAAVASIPSAKGTNKFLAGPQKEEKTEQSESSGFEGDSPVEEFSLE